MHIIKHHVIAASITILGIHVVVIMVVIVGLGCLLDRGHNVNVGGRAQVGLVLLEGKLLLLMVLGT